MYNIKVSIPPPPPLQLRQSAATAKLLQTGFEFAASIKAVLFPGSCRPLKQIQPQLQMNRRDVQNVLLNNKYK